MRVSFAPHSIVNACLGAFFLTLALAHSASAQPVSPHVIGGRYIRAVVTDSSALPLDAWQTIRSGSGSDIPWVYVYAIGEEITILERNGHEVIRGGKEVLNSVSIDFWDYVRSRQLLSKNWDRKRIPVHDALDDNYERLSSAIANTGFSRLNLVDFLRTRAENLNREREWANGYISELGAGAHLAHEPVSEQYLADALREVYPMPLNEMRLIVLNYPSANAMVLADGTIIISTGLLAATVTREELLGVLAHEVAHFALDHHLIHAEERRRLEEKAAAQTAWAGVLTAVTSLAAVYVVADAGYDPAASSRSIQNSVTLSMASASRHFAESAAIAGAAFSRDLESYADLTAALWLKRHGYDPTSVVAPLLRLPEGVVGVSATHDSAIDRAREIAVVAGLPDLTSMYQVKSDPHHDQMLAFLLSRHAVYLLMAERDYQAAYDLFMRIRNAKAADARDLALLARTARLLNKPHDHVHAFLDEADARGVSHIALLERGLQFVREGRREEASHTMTRYMEEFGQDEKLEGVNEWARSFMERLGGE